MPVPIIAVATGGAGGLCRHFLRHYLERSGTRIVVGVLLIGVAWLGITPKSSLLELQCGLACPVMLIPMLFRLDLYTGRVGHRAHAA